LLVPSILFVFYLRAQDVNPGQQTEPAKKPAYDYMSTFLMRNTKPLGLKANEALDRLLKQPSINWAIRAAARHILD
jgi:hypothetical protein